MGKVRDRARGLLGIAELHARLDRQRAQLDEQHRELQRLGPQVAALERMEDLRQLVERAALPTGQEAGVADALARIEREHEQVRARITAAARFEERLRVVERTAEPRRERLTGRPAQGRSTRRAARRSRVGGSGSSTFGSAWISSGFTSTMLSTPSTTDMSWAASMVA